MYTKKSTIICYLSIGYYFGGQSSIRIYLEKFYYL